MSVFEDVKEMIVEQVRCEDWDITPTVTLLELGFDSLADVELTMSIEEKYDIEIPDADVVDIKTVNDIIEYINKNT